MSPERRRPGLRQPVPEQRTAFRVGAALVAVAGLLAVSGVSVVIYAIVKAVNHFFG